MALYKFRVIFTALFCILSVSLWAESSSISDPTYTQAELDAAVADAYQQGLAAGGGSTGTTTIKLTNISARAAISGGAYDMFGGFAITGTGSQTVLIRGIAVDPGVDPVIKILNNSTKAQIATNDNWGQASNASQITALPAAYHLPDRNGNDAGLLLSLPAGVYDVQLSSNGAHGLALIGVDAID